jgi:hypothetical protein
MKMLLPSIESLLLEDERLRKLYLSNIVVHVAFDSGMDLLGALLSLASVYDQREKQLVHVLEMLPPGARL